MNLLQTVALSYLALAPSFVVAGNEYGNGGTAWTCRSMTDHDVLIRAELREVFETLVMRPQLILSYRSLNNRISESTLRKRLISAEKEFHFIRKGMAKKLVTMERDIRNSASWQTRDLPLTHDWKHSSKDWEAEMSLSEFSIAAATDARLELFYSSWCPGGQVALEQLAVDFNRMLNPGKFDSTQLLPVSVNLGIFKKLSHLSAQALWWHEAIYRYRRKFCGDRSSYRSRVALIQLLSGEPITGLICE